MKQKKRKKKMSSEKKHVNLLLVEMLASIAIALFITIGIFFYFFSIKVVPNETMSPLFKKGEKIIVQKNINEINRFDVVSLEINGEEKIGRVIGLPEESIHYIDDYLYINELPVDEKFIVDQVNEAHLNEKLYTSLEDSEKLFRVNHIPKGYYFILGDNRPNATDSRFYGVVAKNKIKGKLLYKK